MLITHPCAPSPNLRSESYMVSGQGSSGCQITRTLLSWPSSSRFFPYANSIPSRRHLLAKGALDDMVTNSHQAIPRHRARVASHAVPVHHFRSANLHPFTLQQGDQLIEFLISLVDDIAWERIMWSKTEAVFFWHGGLNHRGRFTWEA